MVPMTAAVVADGTADGVGDNAQIRDDLFERLGFQRGVAGDGLVEVVHIRLVMAVVMDLHRQRVKVGFEGCLVIGQGREFVGHNFPWLWFVVKLLAANCVTHGLKSSAEKSKCLWIWPNPIAFSCIGVTVF